MTHKVPDPIAAFEPCAPFSAAERGDTGRGPMPKAGLTLEDRHVNLKSPGKGKRKPGPAVTATGTTRPKTGRPRLTLAQKGA